MSEAWTFAGESASLGRVGGVVTLVEETSFCLSGRSGDVQPNSPQGLFYLDTRLLSRFELRLDGQSPEPLSVAVDEPFAATFVCRARARHGHVDSQLLVLRRRYVGRGLREDLIVRNYAAEPVQTDIELTYEVDFANLFAVKESRVERVGEHGHEIGSDGVEFRHRSDGVERAVRLHLDQADTIEPGHARWRVVVPAHGEWSTCVAATVVIGGEAVTPRYACGEPVADTAPSRRMEEWRRRVPTLDTDHVSLEVAFRQSLEDVGSLRLFDPGQENRPVVAAGAPWFMTIFGRDSLLTSYMTLLADHDLALGVLHVLARLQGSEVYRDSEEQPGRILHEIRYGASASLDLAAGSVYYGSVDATPLFVLLLAELRRWGCPLAHVEPLIAHADRALRWVEDYGDRDGDGYVEYQRMTPNGLENQGWKDSWDGIPFADGRLPEAPIALCEVQGYVYAAYRGRAMLAREAGDGDTARHCDERAQALKERFNRDFWLPDRGYFAIGLDGAKAKVDGLASNMGQCLWTGIVDDDKAGSVAEHLLSPEMFSGWGIRTLATSMASYNPNSYHCGSVWPHDNALIAAGLMRYGYVEQARRVIDGMLDAAAAQGGRLPELFCGFARDDVSTPVSYPTSCSPQAWSAAAPLEFLRTLLRLDPDVPAGRFWLDPALPTRQRMLTVDGVPVAGARLRIRAGFRAGDGVLDVTGAPPTLGLVRSPRPR